MKIAIVKLSAMGDIVHAMVALQFIKRYRPDIKIDWIVEESFAGVLKHNSHIDHILTVNLKSIKKNRSAIFSEIKKVRNYAKNNYDLVIDAQGLLKSAIVSKLLAKNVAGFSKNSIREKMASYFYNKKVDISYSENVIKRNLKILCEPLGINIKTDEINSKQPFLYFKNSSFECIAKEKKNILFILGASKSNKVYPKERFAEISNSFKSHNIIAIWGNDKEYDIAQYIGQHSKNVIICNKLSLDGLKSLISKVDLVIGGDTGPTHMAWGLNIPSIIIFGNTSEYRNTFISDINKVIKSSSTVDSLNLDKNDFSIADIDSSKIINIAKELLDL